jgi:transposase
LNEAECVCLCCSEVRHAFGVELTGQLDSQPASLFVVEHAGHNCACAGCQGEVVRAANAPHAVEKGLPGDGLSVQAIFGKFLEHLPLYRQKQIFDRQGIPIIKWLHW